MNYRLIILPKGNGKVRKIYAPDAELKAQLRLIFPELREYMLDTCDYSLCHGFMPGRSPVTNAAYHAGYRYTLNMDLQDFFDSVTPEHLSSVPRRFLAHTLIDGAPRQGLPTSPLLANIAAAPLDDKLQRLAPVYTRYADDLTFSSDELGDLYRAREEVMRITAELGFTVNPRKTHIQGIRAGRRIITGLAVDMVVSQTRKNRRKARAANHQLKSRCAQGLEQWFHSPRPLCPVCWKKVRGSVGSLAWHIRRHFEGPRTAVRGGGIAAGTKEVRYLFGEFSEALEDPPRRGGIKDYGPVYQFIRQHYVRLMMEDLPW